MDKRVFIPFISHYMNEQIIWNWLEENYPKIIDEYEIVPEFCRFDNFQTYKEKLAKQFEWLNEKDGRVLIVNEMDTILQNKKNGGTYYDVLSACPETVCVPIFKKLFGYNYPRPRTSIENAHYTIDNTAPEWTISTIRKEHLVPFNPSNDYCDYFDLNVIKFRKTPNVDYSKIDMNIYGSLHTFAVAESLKYQNVKFHVHKDIKAITFEPNWRTSQAFEFRFPRF